MDYEKLGEGTVINLIDITKAKDIMKTKEELREEYKERIGDIKWEKIIYIN